MHVTPMLSVSPKNSRVQCSLVVHRLGLTQASQHKNDTLAVLQVIIIRFLDKGRYPPFLVFELISSFHILFMMNLSSNEWCFNAFASHNSCSIDVQAYSRRSSYVFKLICV